MLSQHAFGWDLGIDQWLFLESAGSPSTTAPGRMGVLASLSFLGLGAALLGLDQRTGHGFLAEWIALTVAILMVFSLVGHAYGAEILYGMVHSTAIAAHTALALLLLSLGVLLARPQQGKVAVLLAPGSGGTMARRLLLPVLALPFVAGWLYLWAYDHQLLGGHTGLAMLVAVLIVILAALVTRSAAALNRAGQALRDGQERLRLIVESAPNALVMVDAKGKILLVNSQVEKLFGYDRSELLGQTVEVLVPQRFRHAHPGYRRQFVAEPQARPMGAGRDLFGLRKDGTEFPVEIGLNPIRTADGLVILSAIVDITQRKQAEEALLRLNETLEERVTQRTSQLRALAAELTQSEERERRKLAQTLHDHLQQLLVAAKMRVSTLIGRAQDEQGRAMAKQVEELLTQSIDESRSLTAQLSPPILYEAGLLAGLEWLARWMEDKHAFKVHVGVQNGQVQEIPEDLRAFLFQAVREMLFNAAKHAKVNSACVGVRPVDAGRVQVIVQDSGVGFDPSAMEDRKDATGGFGLFSVRERLLPLGGRLDIKSAPGQGTRLTLEVPLHPAQARAVAEELTEAVAAAVAEQPIEATKRTARLAKSHVTIRVLLADDHKIVREGLAGLLAEQLDLEVVGQAGDGLAAVELAHRLKPDVVIMDVTMPRLTGIEATRRLAVELPQTKIIGLSMHQEEDMAQAMRQAGAVAYLSKDGPPDDLIAAIRRYQPSAA